MGIGKTTLQEGGTFNIPNNYKPPMDLLNAADELRNIVHSSMLVVDAWRDGNADAIPDSLNDALVELESELKRVEEI